MDFVPDGEQLVVKGLNREIMKRFKHLCIERETTMSEVVRHAVAAVVASGGSIIETIDYTNQEHKGKQTAKKAP